MDQIWAQTDQIWAQTDQIWAQTDHIWVQKDEKPYTDFIFPENIPEHEWNRNAA